MTTHKLLTMRVVPLALVTLALAACTAAPNAAQPDDAADDGAVSGAESGAESGVAADGTSGGAAADLAAAGLSEEALAALSPDADMLVPVEFIKEAHDAGVDVLFVDARPDLDYEFGHIPGAVNVPYFEADEHLAELPRDRLIVSYCECPHAEAVQVADALVADGFPHVKVIDEGLFGWTDLGGETVAGATDSD